jgi:hypothetical protein
MATVRPEASATCDFREHGTCVSCPEFVTRRSRHGHFPKARPERGWDIICGECVDMILMAAMPITQAAIDLQLEGSAHALAEAYANRRIAVLIQGAMSL